MDIFLECQKSVTLNYGPVWTLNPAPAQSMP